MSFIRRWSTWWPAVFAGLPHLLFAVALDLPVLGRDWPFLHTHWRLPALIFFGLVGLVWIFAWRRGWPRWSATWLGYGLLLVWLLPSYLSRNYVETGFTMLVWLALSAAACLWFVGRDHPSGLLVALPLVTVLTSRLALDEAYPLIASWLSIGLGLLTGIVAGAITHLGDRRLSMWLVLAVNLLASLSVTYVSLYHSYYPVTLIRFPQGGLDVLISFVLPLLASSILVTSPAWVWKLWQRDRRSSPGRV